MNTIHVCTFFGPPGIGQNKLCKISTRTSKSGLRQGEKMKINQEDMVFHMSGIRPRVLGVSQGTELTK